MPRAPKLPPLVGDAPYRAQPLSPPPRPPWRPPWRRWARAVYCAALLVFVVGAPVYVFGGFWHLPARARLVCAASPSVGAPFSLTRFRALAALVGFMMPHRLQSPNLTWSALGRWSFLRCYCHVEVARGVVARKDVGCFD